jgi:epoxyqueuosine reductase
LDRLTGKIKDYALRMGVKVFGIADAGNLEGAPEGHRPRDVLKGAKNVILLGIPTPKAIIVDGLPTSYTRSQFSMHSLLDILAAELAVMLEENDVRAIPVAARHLHMETLNGKIMADLSFKHAAVQAGIGEMGMNTLLLHPKYGARLNLIGIVTDGAFAADRPFKEKVCNWKSCFKCVEACPVKALNTKGEINKERCNSFFKMHKNLYVETDGLITCRECRKVCPLNG